MSGFDPYRGHRETGFTVSPEAVTPKRAMDDVELWAQQIAEGREYAEQHTEVVRLETDTRVAPVVPLREDVKLSPMAQAAAGVAGLWDGVERETTVVPIETDTRVVPVRGGERWSLRRKLVFWGGVALMATGAIWAGVNHFTMSDEEFAQELLRRGEDPAAYCASKGGVLDVVSTSGTNEDGEGYVNDEDLQWKLWGNQRQLVFDANRVELGAGGELGICNPSDPDDGQRDKLLIVPTRTNSGELLVFLASRN